MTPDTRAPYRRNGLVDRRTGPEERRMNVRRLRGQRGNDRRVGQCCGRRINNGRRNYDDVPTILTGERKYG
jgi:hypothetical protein